MEAQASPPRPSFRDERQARWILRFFGIGAILFAVIPPIAIGLSGWWMLQDLGPVAQRASTYRSAPACRASAVGIPCYTWVQGELTSLSRINGKCGSHTDRLTIALADGSRTVDIGFDCLGPNLWYADASGQVSVKQYEGQITAVRTTDGQTMETLDSPAVGRSIARGVFAGAAALFGPWLVISLYVVARHPSVVKGVWRLVRDGGLREPESLAA